MIWMRLSSATSWTLTSEFSLSSTGVEARLTVARKLSGVMRTSGGAMNRILLTFGKGLIKKELAGLLTTSMGTSPDHA